MKITTLLFVAWFGGLSLVTAAHAQPFPPVPNPIVTGPIEGGVRGHPFLDSPFDLAQYGYMEHEYFLTGIAANWEAPATPSAPYTTRILVRRPIDPARFDGTVLIEWLNVTIQWEQAADWTHTYGELLRQGYAYVAVSAQSAGTCCSPNSLKIWDPVRYETISHPGDGFSYDIFSQAVKAVRSPQPHGIDPTGGLAVQRMLATGASQSAGFLWSYVAIGVQYFHGLIDGFHINVGGLKTFPEPPYPTIPSYLTVPVLHVQSTREQDPSAPIVDPNYRLWEIASASHADFWQGLYGTEDFERYGENMPPNDPVEQAAFEEEAGNYGAELHPYQDICAYGGNMFPKRYAQEAAIASLERWVKTGTPPPQPPRIQFNGTEVAVDEYGNSLGGLRLPPVDVPVARYVPAVCGVDPVIGFNWFGVTIPFTPLEIAERYPDHANYYCQMQTRTGESVRDGFMLRVGGEDLLRRAAKSEVKARFPAVGVPDCDADGVADAVDNCPLVANADQLDRGGVATATPDGIGDACQCGDVTANGQVNGQDRNTIERHVLGLLPNALYLKPAHCDVTGDGSCNTQDADAVRSAALGLPTPALGQHCGTADLFAPVCTNCN